MNSTTDASRADLPEHAYASLLEAALREDLGADQVDPTADLTAAWATAPEARATATIIARAPGVVAGMPVARAVFARLDGSIVFEAMREDGEEVASRDVLARLAGPAAPLLTGERTALNFLQQLSGVATLTRRYVRAVAGTGARITDTRKTTPGQRLLQKYAVRQGGGVNHRMGLYDAVLIKENHAATVGGVAAAVQRARERMTVPGARAVPVFVEATCAAEVRSLVPLAPDRILLDNMTPEAMHRSVEIVRAGSPATEIEATGGVSLDNVRLVAETGVDLISVGALTHSAPALDLSMLFDLQA